MNKQYHHFIHAMQDDNRIHVVRTGNLLHVISADRTLHVLRTNNPTAEITPIVNAQWILKKALQIPVTKLLRKEIGIGGVQEGRKNTDEYRKQKKSLQKICDIYRLMVILYRVLVKSVDLIVSAPSGQIMQNLALDWDAKRNRWNECDPQTHISRLLKSTKKREQTRKLPREEKNVSGKEKEASKFAGENFIRYTDEIVQANEAQVVAWQPYCVKELIFMK
ncbi:Pre-mRNA-splicing factor [Dirofilaria immitis]